MKFGFSVVYRNSGDPEFFERVAELIEQLGFESLWTADHVVLSASTDSAYPYSQDGGMGIDPHELTMPDPLIHLAYAAARTRTLRLATGILILPQRNPLVLAKEAATLDRLARGRLMLGVGVGWHREEMEAVGVPFEERGARCDEAIQVMRKLWREEESTFAGRFSRFERAILQPKPAQKDGVPIIVGGHTPAAARRAGRLGDGFFPFRFEARELLPLFALAHDTARSSGRDPERLELTAPVLGNAGLDRVKALADLGISRLMVPSLGFPDSFEKIKSKLGRFSDRVISPLA